MDRLTQSILLVLIGGVLTVLELSGRFMLYVKAGIGPLLLAGGIVLVVVGVASTTLAMRDRIRQARASAAEADAHDVPLGDGPPDDLGDAHDGERTWAAWLLLLPVLAVLLLPPALGADAVARDAGSQALSGPPPEARPATEGSAGTGADDGFVIHFPPLAAGKNPAVPLKEFVQRALYAPDSLVDTPVTVTGFVARAAYGYSGGYSLARMIISCCAADARAMQIQIEGSPPFPENTWVTAVVTVQPGSGTLANGYVPTATVASIAQVEEPADPYER